MSSRPLVVPVLVLAAAAGGATAVVAGIRRRDPRVVGAVTRHQRSTVNPRRLEAAGGTGARMSVVCHRGRRSGAPYETPVGIREIGGELVVLLPYGVGADWVRNVRAAGGATVRHDGRSVEVTEPEVLPFAVVAPRLGLGDRWTAAVFGIREVLVLRPRRSVSAGA